MTTIDRINTLVRESTETALDSAALVQRQNAELVQSWLGASEAGQKAARDLTLQGLKQTQEAQSLWVELVQESVNVGVDNVSGFDQNGLKETARPVRPEGKTAAK